MEISALKPVEHVAKLLLALFAAVLLWRPWRRHRAQRLVGRPKKILLVRIDDRVGEALLTTPLFESLRARSFSPTVHVLVHSRVTRVLQGHPMVDQMIPLDRRALALGAWAPGIAALRREGYEVVVNCASWSEPSVTSALVARLAGPRAAVVGPNVWPVRHLHDVNVSARKDTESEVKQRVHLLSALSEHRAVERLSFRQPQPGSEVRALLAQLAAAPFAVVNPGGRLGWRRVPPAVFSAAARVLAEQKVKPLVTWGPNERELAEEVVRHAPGAQLAPATDLDELAALFAASRLVVCNNTGPMHLAVAVGAPTVALFWRMPPSRWGHFLPPHAMVDLTSAADPASQVAGVVRKQLEAIVAV